MPPYILRYVLENRKWKKYLGLFARRKLAPTNFPTWNDYFLSKIWLNLRCKMPVYSPSLLPYSNYTKPNTRYLISNRSFRKLMPCDHFCSLFSWLIWQQCKQTTFFHQKLFIEPAIVLKKVILKRTECCGFFSAGIIGRLIIVSA